MRPAISIVSWGVLAAWLPACGGPSSGTEFDAGDGGANSDSGATSTTNGGGGGGSPGTGGANQVGTTESSSTDGSNTGSSGSDGGGAGGSSTGGGPSTSVSAGGSGQGASGGAGGSEATTSEASSATTGSNATCSGDFTCGGDVVGRWQLLEVCVDEEALAEQLAERLPECVDLFESISYTARDYVVEFSSDGTWSGTGSVEAEVSLELSKACVEAIREMPGMINEAVCTALESYLDTGDASCTHEMGRCHCEITTEVFGDEAGVYSVENGQLVTPDSDPHDYCVEGETLRMADTYSRLVLTRL